MEEHHLKLWSVIDRCKVTTLITQGPKGYPHARTMECLEARQVEEIWFTTSMQERKVTEIKNNEKVTVFYNHKEKGWACVYGQAEVIVDQELKNRFWKDEWERYFENGPESDEYVLIRVVPTAADYLLHDGYERGHIEF